MPLNDVGPPGEPLGSPYPWLPEAFPVVPSLMAPPAAGPLLPTAPGESPPLVEGPVPLNDVGPPAVPLGLPFCANAKVPDTANADANTIVVSLMADSFWLGKEDKPQSWRAKLR